MARTVNPQQLWREKRLLLVHLVAVAVVRKVLVTVVMMLLQVVAAAVMESLVVLVRFLRVVRRQPPTVQVAVVARMLMDKTQQLARAQRVAMVVLACLLMLKSGFLRF